jgi:hypothetical protein
LRNKQRFFLMQFRTEITPPPAEFTISPTDKILLLGSCFAENMAERLIRSGFSINVNPFGTAYNPLSVANGLHGLLSRRIFDTSDLFFSAGAYHSFAHHSRFSHPDPHTALAQMNHAAATAAEFLQQANLLIITFGTAQVFRRTADGQIVANCHKLPAQEFDEYRLPIDTITHHWRPLIADLHRHNPTLHILFTVSPIRHRKHGDPANQLSKATLHLAVHALTEAHPACHYFPASELMMDDLRDYRFYADDLLHPNAQAIAYIWEKFAATYFDRPAQEQIRLREKAYKQAQHREIIGGQANKPF